MDISVNKNFIAAITPFLAALVLSACGSGGGSSSDAGPNPPAPTPAPTLTLTASATTVDAGDPVTLDWNATNADGCTASGGWIGGRSTSGTETITNLTTNQTYTLSCAGSGGGVLQEVSVQVLSGPGAPSITFNADKTIVGENRSVELSWTTTDAQSCTASGDWSGNQPTAGSFTTAALTEAATFVLTCAGSSDSTVSMVAIEVVDLTVTWIAPTQNIDDTPLTDLAGFRIYYGTQSGVYTNTEDLPPQTTSWQADLPQGSYFITVTAFDANDDESAPANEVQRIVP